MNRIERTPSRTNWCALAARHTAQPVLYGGDSSDTRALVDKPVEGVLRPHSML